MKNENPVTKTDPTKALLDIVFFFALAAGIYFLEKWSRSVGFNPLPEGMDGAVTLLVSLAFVLKLNQIRGFTLRDLGLFALKKWWMIPAFGLLVLVVQIIARLFITPALAKALGGQALDLSIYDYLYQNLGMTVLTMVGAMFTGGFIEEVLYRGFMIHRLTAVFGGGRLALYAAAMLNALPFGLIHYEWGFGGIILTTVMGAVMGLMYLVTKRNLWPLIMAHAILDAILISTLYFNKGSEVPF
ncbi:MAG: CPBP family intramembrane glutamic endopeptidase [Sphingomonadales bacterium]